MEVDYQKLLLNDDKFDHNYYGMEKNPDLISEFGHNDLINDWLIEHVRRFNASALHLIRALNSVSTVAEILAKWSGDTSEETYVLFLNEHRNACRDACINMDIYVEKVKAFCRYYFFMDTATKTDSKLWRETLQQFYDIKHGEALKGFIDSCDKIIKDSDIQYLLNIRNDEIHNESPFELIRYKFEESRLVPCPMNYVVDNESIHNKLVEAISKLISVTSTLQNVIEKIPPYMIWLYIDKNNEKLKNVMKVEERYKLERGHYKKYSTEKRSD